MSEQRRWPAAPRVTRDEEAMLNSVESDFKHCAPLTVSWMLRGSTQAPEAQCVRMRRDAVKIG